MQVVYSFARFLILVYFFSVFLMSLVISQVGINNNDPKSTLDIRTADQANPIIY